MRFPLDRLPEKFPIGTRYVVEGRRCGPASLRIALRYIEFPDGRAIVLPPDPVRRARSRRPARGGVPMRRK